MASLYGYFDESGKFLDHPIVVFAGFVDGFQPWYEFYGKWNQWLRRYKIQALHAAEALRHSQTGFRQDEGWVCRRSDE